MIADPAKLLFEIEERDVLVPFTSELGTRYVRVPGKKALVAADDGSIVGVVGSNYRIVTNDDALKLCKKLCAQVFSDTKPLEWEVKAAWSTRSRSRASFDLIHKAHIMNLWDLPGGSSETFTPFVRVGNSYNGLRALRFDLGFMREHCSNGVVFEKEVATLKVAHTKQAVAGLDFKSVMKDFGKFKDEFSDCLKVVRSLTLSKDDSLQVVRTVLGLPEPPEDSTPRQRSDFAKLGAHLDGLHEKYRKELGENAYAAFNTATDFATRPPSSFLVRREPATLQQRSGQWLRSMIRTPKPTSNRDVIQRTMTLFN